MSRRGKVGKIKDDDICCDKGIDDDRRQQRSVSGRYSRVIENRKYNGHVSSQNLEQKEGFHATTVCRWGLNDLGTLRIVPIKNEKAC